MNNFAPHCLLRIPRSGLGRFGRLSYVPVDIFTLYWSMVPVPTVSVTTGNIKGFFGMVS